MLKQAKEKPATTQRMSSSDRRDQILDIAKQIVAEDGFLAVSMKRLAEEAGITRTLIYQQFGDLTGVLAALVEREFAKELAIYLRSTAKYPGGGVEQFVSVIEELLQGVDENPAAWRLFLMPSEGSPKELHERLQEGRAMVQMYLAESLKSAAEKGASVVINEDFDLGAKSINAVAENVLRLRLEDPENFSHKRLLNHVRLLSQMLFGLPTKP
ncbi:MAG TPA: TetR/AcrR family transcriptional regulator [Alcanivoracaceae bacterium]|nr:TetR/AcrR family transcriptional regulator [Alcanivoracaceae bacterium]